jgi:2Fe-2S ferredoxin
MARILLTDLQGEKHDIEGQVGRSIMETLREFEFGVAAICGGMCSCATCHVYVAPEWASKLPEPQSDEKALIQELESYRPDQSRLSCQVPFTEELDGIQMQVAPEE